PLQEQCQRLTRTGQIFGSPLYMSPEQCMGRDMDGRSDIYSLGCVLFEALTGQSPFSATTSVELVSKHMLETPQWPDHCQPVPEQLQSIVKRAMEKDPKKRFSTCKEMSEAIKRTSLANAARAAAGRSHSLASRARGNRWHLLPAVLIACAGAAAISV